MRCRVTDNRTNFPVRNKILSYCLACTRDKIDGAFRGVGLRLEVSSEQSSNLNVKAAVCDVHKVDLGLKVVGIQ